MLAARPRTCRCGGSSRFSRVDQLADGSSRTPSARRRTASAPAARYDRHLQVAAAGDERRRGRRAASAWRIGRPSGRRSTSASAAAPGAAVIADAPPRARPIASISSMKPIAPPSLRAVLRSALKYWRIFFAVAPWNMDWNDVALDEQERHAGLGGHRLGGVRLAGARTTLEEQAAARAAAHLAGEGAVREEEVQRADDLLLDDVDADDVLEPGVDLLGPGHVRRPAGEDELPEEEHDQQREEQGRDQQQRVDARQVEEVERVAGEDAVPEVGGRARRPGGRAVSSRLRRSTSRVRPTSAPPDRPGLVEEARSPTRSACLSPTAPPPSCVAVPAAAGGGDVTRSEHQPRGRLPTPGRRTSICWAVSPAPRAPGTCRLLCSPGCGRRHPFGPAR